MRLTKNSDATDGFSLMNLNANNMDRQTIKRTRVLDIN
jgi:hypothetical protein